MIVRETEGFKKWKKGHSKLYYFYTVNNNLRIEFFDHKLDKRRMFQRSIAKYSTKIAKQELWELYQKAIGEKQKLYQSPKRYSQDKLITGNVVAYNSLKDIPFDAFFNTQGNNSGRTLFLLSKSGSGKTTLLADLYNDVLKHVYDIITLMSGSITAPIYKKFKGAIKMGVYSPEYIKELYTYQKHTKGRHKVLTILDDLDKGNKTQDHSFMSKQFLRMRNNNMSVILSAQDFTLLNKSDRGNAHMIGFSKSGFERKDYIIDILKPFLWDEYDTAQNNKVRINKWINDHTDNYGWIFIDTINNILYHRK